MLANQQIVFIDSQVADYQLLVSGVEPGTEVVILKSDRDGIEQITEILNQRNNYTSIHIVSHGSPGCLYLSNTNLSLNTLNQYQSELETWFSPSPLVSKSPSLLLYGCNVAAGDAGEEFITKLHDITGAEIAASTTPIGNAAKGDNWELDITTKAIDTTIAFNTKTKQSYAGILGEEEPPAPELAEDLNEEIVEDLPTVTTDKQDYAPGSTATITGKNFKTGETVELEILHNDGTPNTGGGHDPWQVTDGGAGDLDNKANGTIITTWFVNPDDSLNSAFDLTATGLNSGKLAAHSFTDSDPAVQLFYIPFPEDNIKTAFDVLDSNSGVSNNVNSVISLTISTDNTIIYYDHWEDNGTTGYESDLSNPTQTDTEIWGDNDDSNGKPPGFTTDILNAGDIISLEQTNTGSTDESLSLPPSDATTLFDGRDKVGASKAIVATRQLWPTSVTSASGGSVLAGAASILDTSKYGKKFELPVGRNTSADSMFEYTSVFITAAEDNTTVSITGVDTNNDGSYNDTISGITLNEGETYFVDGDPTKVNVTLLSEGATVTADKDIQAHLVTGDIAAAWEARWFTLFPTEQWSNNYYTPVGTVDSENPAEVFLYNPNASEIDVFYRSVDSSGNLTTSTIPLTIQPGTTKRYRLETNTNSGTSDYGAHFYTDSTDNKFFAVSAVDANDTSETDGNNSDHDWGFPLVPDTNLTPLIQVGWGLGSSDGTENGSPIWVSATEATTIYVDYDGDKAGSLTDINGNQYDESFEVEALESLRITDTLNNDNDQSGIRIYTVDGTNIMAAWGQDPANSTRFSPYLDLGTAILPLPIAYASKTAELEIDNKTSDVVDPGDTLEYTINVRNDGVVILGNVNVSDTIPQGTTYVPGSSTVGGVPIGDDTSGTPFPFDDDGVLNGFDGGRNVGNIQVDETLDVTYDLLINDPYDGPLEGITNSAVIDSDEETLNVAVNTPVNIPTTTKTLYFSDTKDLDRIDPANSDPVDNSNSTTGNLVRETVRDEFTTAAYNNNNGSVNWSSNWIEIDDNNNNPQTGRVEINAGQLELSDYDESTSSGDSGKSPGLYREIDLSNATTAALSFDYDTSGNLENSDVLTIDVLNDNDLNFTTLGTLFNDGTGSRSYNLEDFVTLTADTQIRFRVTGNTNPASEFFYIDNVQVAYDDPFSFTQSIPMQSNLELPSGNNITVTAYIDDVDDTIDVNNPANNELIASVSYDNTSIGTANQLASVESYNDGDANTNAYKVTWNIALDNNVIVPNGENVNLKISSRDTETTNFKVLYDSATYPSKIDFATRSIIDVTSVGVYDAAGSGNQINASADGEEVYIRVEVEDPFGDYDITGLDIDITDPNGNALTTIPLDSADDIDTTVDGKRIYESAWTPPSTLGEFTINVEAQEGLEGTVVDTGSTTHTVNNGNVPNVLIGDDIVTEGTSLIFDVDPSTTSITDIVLDLAATDGTATGTSDYETTGFEYSTDGGTTWIPAGGTNGTEVTIPSGSLGIKVRIDSVSDNADEPDETFTLGVNNVISGDVGDTSDTGTGTITDDDSTPNISIGDAQLIEGDTGQKVLTFAVTLDSPSSLPVTVNYATSDVSATSNDTDPANDDYVAETGTVTFAPGETNATITINTIGDTRVEPNETFTVDLSNPANANIADGSGTGTIIDDDQVSVFSINNASIVEGDSGTKTLKFTVTRTGSTSGTASVDFATADNTATIANSDYSSKTGTLTFTDGEPQEISITINGDDAIEADETFFVNLSNPVNGTINNAQGVGTIVNDDLSGTISGNVKADTNDDDIGDQNLSGVTITLISGGVDGIIDDNPNTSVDESADNIIVTKFTDTSGNYSFENLEEDTYRVEQTNLAGYDDVFEFDRVIDSVADDTDLENNATANDNRLTVVLSEGETDSGNDFVDEQLGSISGTVKVDANGDGVGDQTLEGVTVTLFKDGTEIDSILTNSNGGYSFDDIPAGDYTVVQTNRTGYYDVKDTDAVNDSTITVSLDAGETSLGNDFVDELRDYGDAADSLPGAVSAADNLANNGNDTPDYQTTEADGGPSHPIVPGLSIGSAPDADDGTLQNAAADADDTNPINSTNDEDGITSFDTLVTNTDTYTINVDVTNNLSSNVDATLVGWIDFDRNGSFDADEAVSTTVSNGATSVSLTWDNTDGDTNNDIPSNIASGTTYARFRLSSDSLTSTDSVGSASDGEVEDYQIDIKNAVDGTGGSEVIDTNTTDGTTDGNDFVIAGAGQDTLTGGTGDDCYHFNITSDGIDVITDFDDEGKGDDRLDFRDIFNDELSSLTIPPNSNPYDAGYVEAIAFGTGVMIVVDTVPNSTVDPITNDSGDDVLNKPVVLLRDTVVGDIDASDFIF